MPLLLEGNEGCINVLIRLVQNLRQQFERSAGIEGRTHPAGRVQAWLQHLSQRRHSRPNTVHRQGCLCSRDWRLQASVWWSRALDIIFAVQAGCAQMCTLLRRCRPMCACMQEQARSALAAPLKASFLASLNRITMFRIITPGPGQHLTENLSVLQPAVGALAHVGQHRVRAIPHEHRTWANHLRHPA